MHKLSGKRTMHIMFVLYQTSVSTVKPNSEEKNPAVLEAVSRGEVVLSEYLRKHGTIWCPFDKLPYLRTRRLNMKTVIGVDELHCLWLVRFHYSCQVADKFSSWNPQRISGTLLKWLRESGDLDNQSQAGAIAFL